MDQAYVPARYDGTNACCYWREQDVWLKSAISPDGTPAPGVRYMGAATLWRRSTGNGRPNDIDRKYPWDAGLRFLGVFG